MKCELNSQSFEKTQSIGEAIGGCLRGGEVIVLESDLGGGKTTLAQGIAKGLGCSEHVSSPTFTVSQVYQGQKYEVHHYDFYRLGADIGIMQQELEGVMTDPMNIVLIEWPQAAVDSLSSERIIHIDISRVVSGENDRDFSVVFPEKLAYVGDALEKETQ